MCFCKLRFHYSILILAYKTLISPDFLYKFYDIKIREPVSVFSEERRRFLKAPIVNAALTPSKSGGLQQNNMEIIFKQAFSTMKGKI